MPTKRGKPTVAERIAAGEITEDPRVANVQKARKKSPLANPELAWVPEPEDERQAYVANTMSDIMQYIWAEKPKNDEEARERISQYFLKCAKSGVKPTVEELALSLGTNHKQLWDWENRRTGPVSADTIKKAKALLAAFDARAVVENKLNPVTYFFRSKNFYGMVDKQEVVLSPGVSEVDRQELEAAAKLLPGE